MVNFSELLKRDRDAKDEAKDHADAVAWAKKHHVKKLPAMHADWAITMLIPYVNFPVRKSRGRS